MNNIDENEIIKSNDDFDWEYAPPPTPYDLIRDNFLSRFMRSVVHMLARLGLRYYNGITVINRDYLKQNWPCIITPNHASHLDTPVIFSSLSLFDINHTFTLAARDYFFDRTVMAIAARLFANAIPVDRTGSESRGLRLCLLKMREGNSILLFPEGTRSTSGEMGQFQKGVILLSRKSRLPIIPAFIKGTFDSMPKSRCIPKRNGITLIFGQAVRYWDEIYMNMDEENVISDLENRVRTLGQSV